MTPSPQQYTHFPAEADLFYLCTTLSTSDTDLNTQLGPPSAPRISVGVVLLESERAQLLDLTPIDMLDMLTMKRAEGLRAPRGVLDQTVELDLRYVSESGVESVPTTSGGNIPVTVGSSLADCIEV